MKVAPVHAALLDLGHRAVLLHTGQHYDARMSEIFFDQLGMPRPEIELGVGSGSHAMQTARIMQTFEPALLDIRPDVVLVAGDVNSTIACALVAVKLGVPTVHLEAGLRSFDRDMPEEINRVLTDAISDLLLTPSPDADANLRREGVNEARVMRVGNTMIDSVVKHVARARNLGVLLSMNLRAGQYAVVTLHRPSNVDHADGVSRLVQLLTGLSARLPVIFPVHPRTRARLIDAGVLETLAGLRGLQITEPLGYLEFLALEADAQFVVTDSGGVQEETTALGVPCLTVRRSTERPITCTEGTNTIVGPEPFHAFREVDAILNGNAKSGRIPDLWDGKAGHRAALALAERWATEARD
jgi:UDP-N-acetylglucosamine 2-epimerase (non-hydrolysing)